MLILLIRQVLMVTRDFVMVQESSTFFNGLGLLSLSAMLPSLSSPECRNGANIMSCSPPQFQVILFFFSLCLIAFAQGRHKPCVQAFGADQFDGKDLEELKARSSFFNWWYLGLCGGPTTAFLFLNYIQDNINWGLGFGIPCISMVVALVIFLIGTRTYKYTIQGHNNNPFFRIAKVFATAARNWRTSSSVILVEHEAKGTRVTKVLSNSSFFTKPCLHQRVQRKECAGSVMSKMQRHFDIMNNIMYLNIIYVLWNIL